MAPGVEKTRPPPSTWTSSWTGSRTKVATVAASAPSATVQPLLAHAPSNPLKPQPAAAEARRLTGVPSGKSAAQIRGQSMPGGSLRTSRSTENQQVAWQSPSRFEVRTTPGPVTAMVTVACAP